MLNLVIISISLYLLAACGHHGKTKNARGNSSAPAEDPNQDIEPTPINEDGTPGSLTLVSQTRRLTRAELKNTLSSLFGNQIWSESNNSLLEEYEHEAQTSRIHGTNSHALNKGQLGAAISLGMSIAETTLQTPTLYSQIFTACPSTPTMTCVDAFFAGKAVNIWRRPLQATEIANLKKSIAGAQPTKEELQILLARMLSAPDFLFHVEDACAEEDCTSNSNFITLSQYAIANRLAYTLTETNPDQELLAAAAAGELATPEDIRMQAERLIETPTAKVIMRSFFHDWLQSNKIKTPSASLSGYFNVASASLSQEAYTELDNLFAYLIEKNYGDVFTTRYLNTPSANLKKLYASTGTQLSQDRGGVAGRIGFLLSAGLAPNIVARGLQIKTNLLCQPVADPDDAIIAQRDDELGEIDKNTMTNRKILELKTSPASCQGCHSSINPPGFALESFGPYGDIRTKDVVFNADGSQLTQLPLDTKTTINMGESKQTWDNASELFVFLSQSDEVKSCLVKRLFQFSRHLPAKTTNPIPSSSFLANIKNDTTIRDIFLDTLATSDFMTRKR